MHGYKCKELQSSQKHVIIVWDRSSSNNLSFLKIPLKIKDLLGKWLDPFTLDAALFCVPISSDRYISTNHGQDLGHLELIYDFRPMIKKVL